MTTERAIRIAEAFREGRNITIRPEELTEYNNIVVDALRSKYDTQSLNPLEIEELKRMAGQPVWIAAIESWALVNVHDDEISFVYFDGSCNTTTEFAFWGAKWQAYRFQLKGDGKNDA